MRVRVPVAWIVACGLAAGAALAAEAPPPGDPAEPVPVFTNADLERFGPSTAPYRPVESNLPDDWGFVQTFLDRQYARIDADFDRQLARRAADRAEVPPRPRYVAPYAGIYGGGYLYPFRYPGSWNRQAERPRHRGAEPLPGASRHNGPGGRPPGPRGAAHR